MRTISILSALALTGCASEYDIVSEDEHVNVTTSGDQYAQDSSDEHEDTDTAVDNDAPVGDDESGEDTDTEDDETNEDLTDPGECGFLVDQTWNREDAETWSLATFSLIGTSEVEVMQGEPLTYQFAVTAHPCGDIELNLLDLGLGYSDENLDSLQNLDDADIEMELVDLSSDSEFDPKFGTSPASQIFYTWCDYACGYNGASEDMDTVLIEAGTAHVFEFTFTGTGFLSVGEVSRLFNSYTIWTDVETGTEIAQDIVVFDTTEMIFTITD